MPELLPLCLILAVSSKFFTLPPRQMRNWLYGSGFSSVVTPVIAPSFTDQLSGLPSQPVRSLPLKSWRSCAIDAVTAASRKNKVTIEERRYMAISRCEGTKRKDVELV